MMEPVLPDPEPMEMGTVPTEPVESMLEPETPIEPPMVESQVPEIDPFTLQSDEFDSSNSLQSFWNVQNGDEGPHMLSNGGLVVEGGFNQNLWIVDSSTRFYQVTIRSSLLLKPQWFMIIKMFVQLLVLSLRRRLVIGYY